MAAGTSRFSARTMYAALAVGSTVLAALLSYTAIAVQFDNNLTDFYFRLRPAPATPSRAAILAIDEKTLQQTGGMRSIRRTLARVLPLVNAAGPAAVAIDLTLTESGDTEEDAALAKVIQATPNLVLATEMLPDGSAWQDPAASITGPNSVAGQVGALPGPYDDVNRRIPLERVAGRQRRWAMSLETLRRAIGAAEIVSSPTDVSAGPVTIESRWDEGRPMRVRYRPSLDFQRISVADLLQDPAKAAALKGKAVFIGVTALSAARDRLFTPLTPASIGLPMPGVEIHAQAFDTMDSRDFLVDAAPSVPLALASALALLIAALFAFAPAALAYAVSALLAIVALVLPFFLLRQGTVIAPFAPIGASWLAAASCAAYQFFRVRGQLETSEASRHRYQQAFRFVAHEMRTPLTAIQGSSELISRYNLPDAKRKELGAMINSESKRLAKMITTFLDVEKLSAGQLELRKELLPLGEVVAVCAGRAAPLAERKQIHLSDGGIEDVTVEADRELLEYAIYNLVTNAIKYSPTGSEVKLSAAKSNGEATLSVQDHGIGMDASEVKSLFTKFFRTRRAEESGETGTGLGLSIVREIVDQHGGRISVQSAPDMGSTFTLHLPIH